MKQISYFVFTLLSLIGGVVAQQNQVPYCWGFGGSSMMGYGGAWGFMWIFGFIFWILILVALILFIVWLIKQLQNPRRRK